MLLLEPIVKPKERPILFQGAMVRAQLAGTKTQTRRVVKGQALEWLQPGMFTPEYVAQRENGLCPYGFPGDRLWVRESWGYFDPDGSGEDYDRDDNDDGKAGPCKAYRDEMMQEGHPLRDYWRRRIAYAASWQDGRYGSGVAGPKRWRPSIHMPRWASRILLEITEVRVQRLQEISEDDALAEGIVPREVILDTVYEAGQHREITGERFIHGAWPRCEVFESAVKAYADLWDSINGQRDPGHIRRRRVKGKPTDRYDATHPVPSPAPYSWDANPWVWAVSFRRVQP